MKTNRHVALSIVFTICLMTISICSCATNRVSSIQYDENLSQTCNHLNSGLIQEYKGRFYELKPVDTEFALYKGDEANKIDEPVDITTTKSGFWIYNDRIFYRAGESGNEIRSANTDGSEDILLFTAPVQEFVVSENGIFWTDAATESLMYYDFASQEQLESAPSSAFCLQQVDGKISCLVDSNSKTEYYEEGADKCLSKVLTFPERVQKYLRLGGKVYAFANYSIYEGDLTDGSIREVMANFQTLSTSVNVYDGKIVFCGQNEDGQHTYFFDPERQSMITIDDHVYQFVFSFDSGLWEYSLDGGMQKISL